MHYFFLVLFLFFSSVAAADDASEVEKTYQAWCTAISTAKGNPQEVVKYYAPKAILLPTLSSKILINQDGGLDAYFKSLTSHKDIQCIPEQLITRVYDDGVAVNAGLYTFSYINATGGKESIPARFSFVYEKENGQWWIVNHHSSKLPAENH